MAVHEVETVTPDEKALRRESGGTLLVDCSCGAELVVESLSPANWKKRRGQGDGVDEAMREHAAANP